MRGRRRFTKVDLLLLIAIVALLLSLLAPSLLKLREDSHLIDCASNMRQLGIAAHSYANDNRTFPQAATYGSGLDYAGVIGDVARYDAPKPFVYGWAFAMMPYVE